MNPEHILRTLPKHVVVDSHGHYWRDYTDDPEVRGYSMPPVSDENTETDVIAIYYLVRPEDWFLATEKARMAAHREAEATRTADRPSLREAAERDALLVHVALSGSHFFEAPCPMCVEARALAERLVEESSAALRQALEDQEAALRAGGSLDEAWAEAEAALPEGWKIERLDLGVWGSWWAYAGRGPERVHGEGDTPAEALSALAAALRGPQATDPSGSATSSKTSTDLREGKP